MHGPLNVKLQHKDLTITTLEIRHVSTHSFG